MDGIIVLRDMSISLRTFFLVVWLPDLLVNTADLAKIATLNDCTHLE